MTRSERPKPTPEEVRKIGGNDTTTCPPDADAKWFDGEHRGKQMCRASRDGFTCTRVRGHVGAHHAHGFRRCFKTWHESVVSDDR